MKAVLALVIVLVIVAVVVNAEEDKKHKPKHNREHKDNKNKKTDRKHNEKKETPNINHGGKRDRDHKTHDSKKKDRTVRNPIERIAKSPKKTDREHEPGSVCPSNEVSSCRSNHCTINCGDNALRQFYCMYQNWLTDLQDKIVTVWPFGGHGPKPTEPGEETEEPGEETGEPGEEPKEPGEEPKEPGEEPKEPGEESECGPRHEHFKCICAQGYILNREDETCVKNEDCPKEE